MLLKKKINMWITCIVLYFKILLSLISTMTSVPFYTFWQSIALPPRPAPTKTCTEIRENYAETSLINTSKGEVTSAGTLDHPHEPPQTMEVSATEQEPTPSTSNSTSDIDQVPDMFNCPICLERFIQPKYLPCLHTVCHDCLAVYIKSSADRNKFQCPVCRQPVYPKDAEKPAKYWADDVPLNHQMVSMMDYLKLNS